VLQRAAEREQSALVGGLALRGGPGIELRLDGQDPDAEPVSASLRADGRWNAPADFSLRQRQWPRQGDDVVVRLRRARRTRGGA
jgi:hypothetical protein